MRYKHKHKEYSGKGHLYREGAKGPEERSFEHRYGKEKGKYVYGATVGKVKRERQGIYSPNMALEKFRKRK